VKEKSAERGGDKGDKEDNGKVNKDK